MLPLATLVTPNLDEAEILTGRKIASVEDMRAAAREIHARFGCAALVKGGHLRGLREAVDIFFDGQTELLLCAPFIKGVSHARHRLHLFRGDLRGAGARTMICRTRWKSAKAICHGGHSRRAIASENISRSDILPEHAANRHGRHNWKN